MECKTRNFAEALQCGMQFIGQFAEEDTMPLLRSRAVEILRYGYVASLIRHVARRTTSGPMLLGVVTFGIPCFLSVCRSSGYPPV